MNPSHLEFALHLLDALRRDLIDDAFVLEQQGRIDAADLAVATAGRVSELRQQLQERRDLPRRQTLSADRPASRLVTLCASG